MKNTLIRQDTAKQIKKIRSILRSMGYLRPKIKSLTEAQRVKLEGRY
jgi:hypothetical protein